MWRAGFLLEHAGHAPVVDLRERQVRRGADVVLFALVRVRAVYVVEAPLGEVLLDVLGQVRLGLKRLALKRSARTGAPLLLSLVTALAVSLPPLWLWS